MVVKIPRVVLLDTVVVSYALKRDPWASDVCEINATALADRWHSLTRGYVRKGCHTR